MVQCPWCGHGNQYDDAFLGRLGYLEHFRCRYCGGTFSSEGDDTLSECASHFRPDEGGEA